MERDLGALIEDLLRDYGRLVFSLCYGMTGDYFDSEDLTQETFISAMNALPSFDGANPKAWLTRIASNKCLDYLKSARRRQTPEDDQSLSLYPDPRPGPESLTCQAEATQQLSNLCARLNQPYRQAALMHFVQGLAVPELSRLTGQNPKTLHTRLYRAREMLQKMWEEEERGTCKRSNT